MHRLSRLEPWSTAGFTLVELLTVTAVVGTLAAVLVPVLAQAREKGRASACISNERQLGMALLQYVADNDDTFPAGLGQVGGERVWAGEGWAGQSLPYHRAPGIFRCPSDTQPAGPPPNQVASYAYNIDLVATPEDWDEEYSVPPPGAALATLNAPARSVLLFEVTGVLANLADAREGVDPGGTPGRNLSASGNGLDHRLYAQRDWTTRMENQYATGYFAGRVPPDPSTTQFQSPVGRHNGGSNYVLCDGHVRWLPGQSVSSGLNASAPNCLQDNASALPGCEGPFHAAGTEANGPAVTFSIR